MAEKRTVVTEEKKGFSVQDLIVVAILLAAGAVLKLVVGQVVNFFGMKPNFVIASYCLAILLTRPKLYQFPSPSPAWSRRTGTRRFPD